MYSLWFIIPVIIAGILKFQKDKKKFDTNFYVSLTNSQLTNEAITILHKILNNFDKKTDFIYTIYKDLNHLKSEIIKLIQDLEKNKIDDLFQTTLIQNQNYYLLELAEKNNWSESQVKLIKDLDLIIIEFSIRQGVIINPFQ